MAPFGRSRKPEGKPRFGNYYAIKLIHDGEKSTVYMGESMPGQPPVAIKLYKKNYDRFARRMEKKYGIPSEGEVGMSLNPRAGDREDSYPLVKTLAHDKEYRRWRGARYIIMEFAKGHNLKNLITCLPEEVKRLRPRIVLQLARALQIIHKRGFVYRDFCPDNVIVGKTGGVKLIDPGFTAPAGIRFEERTGTPAYMSPEQIRCERIDFQSDVYSFGCILYELVAGQTPYTSSVSGLTHEATTRRQAEIMEKHLDAPMPAPTGRFKTEAGHLAGIIERCLQKRPEDRYADAQGLIDAMF